MEEEIYTKRMAHSHSLDVVVFPNHSLPFNVVSIWFMPNIVPNYVTPLERDVKVVFVMDTLHNYVVDVVLNVVYVMLFLET